jgi:ABC-type nitrate/sulfonate/bicarbonate transport system permease component
VADVRGYFIGVALGVLVGLLMGYVRFFYNLLEPITEVLRPIPSPAYLPIVILFLGIDDEMKIFMIAFASFFPVLLNTYSGVRSVDPVQLQTARTFGVSGGSSCGRSCCRRRRPTSSPACA